MSAPRKGLEVRQNVMLRLEPSEKELLIKHFGGVQAALDSVVDKLRKKELKPLRDVVRALKKSAKKRAEAKAKSES